MLSGMTISSNLSLSSATGKIVSPVIRLVTLMEMKALWWTLPVFLMVVATVALLVKENPGISLSKISPLLVVMPVTSA